MRHCRPRYTHETDGKQNRHVQRPSSARISCYSSVWPQGSVLGPVLFNLYLRSIYLLSQRLKFDIVGFADDHQILRAFYPAQQVEILSQRLTICFYVMEKWMAQFFLQLNSSKTQIIILGPSNVLKNIDISGVAMTVDTIVPI